MSNKTAGFFHPHPVTIITFLILALIIPVLYVSAEPQRTNYQPKLQPRWEIKARLYDGLLDEYLFHTEGNLDILAGILHRDYVSNYMGVPLFVIYYLIASGIKSIFCKIVAKKIFLNEQRTYPKKPAYLEA